MRSPDIAPNPRTLGGGYDRGRKSAGQRRGKGEWLAGPVGMGAAALKLHSTWQHSAGNNAITRLRCC